MRRGDPTARGKALSKIERTERLRRVEALMLQGFTTREIAAKTGSSKATVSRDGQRVHELWKAEATELRQIAVERELKKLARDERAIRHEIRAHDDELKLKAYDRLMRVMERRAKLLGMDAPERVESRTEVVAERTDLEALLANPKAQRLAHELSVEIYGEQPVPPAEPPGEVKLDG